MYKSSSASKARGEPTTPKLRPIELSPDMAPSTRPDTWILPAAEPRHRTARPIKSSLKRSSSQAPPPPERPSRDIDGDSGYGSGSSNSHTRNTYIVHTRPLGPPGVSGSPNEPTRPLAEQDSNRPNSRRQLPRPQQYLPPDPTLPVIPPPRVQEPMLSPVHPAADSYRYDQISPISRESHQRNWTMNEKLPQNTSSAEPHYASISPITTRARGHDHPSYGPTQGPYASRPLVHSGWPVYGPPPPQNPAHQQYYYPTQHAHYHKQASVYHRRINDAENYGGQSDTEVGRPPQRHQRPLVYPVGGGGGYSSDNEGMRQYLHTGYHGGESAPHVFSGRPASDKYLQERQKQQERLQHQQMRGVQPSAYPAQPTQQTSNEPVAWIRMDEALRIQGYDKNGHRLSTAAGPPHNGVVSRPRGWTEPPLLRGVTLSWPILEYKQRRRGPSVKPMVFFDISQDPEGTDGRGIRLLSRGDYGMSKDFSHEFKTLPFSTHAKMKYIDMKCTAPELQPWNVIIEHSEGIQVIDFFRAIYTTYQERLTPDELYKYRALVNTQACQRAFKRRCQRAPGSTEYNERQGIRRVDLVGDRTLYLRLHCDSDTKRYEFDLIKQNQANICDSELVPHHN